MQYYQLTYLISPDFSEKETRTLQEKINSAIVKKQGILDKIKIFGRRELGSPIKNFFQAYLVKSNFFLEPQKIENFKKELEEENKILRFFILKEKKEKPLKIKKRVLIPAIKEKRGVSVNKQTISVNKQTKVELKEIDKKLEEILGE